MRGHENHRIRSSETKIGMIIKTYQLYTGVNGRFTSMSPKMGMLEYMTITSRISVSVRVLRSISLGENLGDILQKAPDIFHQQS